MSTNQSVLLDGQEHPVRAGVGHQPEVRANSSYLSQVDFQPLPTKVQAQSIKQILSIK